jgi:ABC-type Fe3+ transport system substrate-binding protein
MDVRRRRFSLVTAGLGLLLSASAGTTAATGSVPDWWVGPPAEFEKMLAGAQREGEVVFWGSSSAQEKAIHAAWPKHWRTKVTFVEVDQEEQITRALTEARAGLHTVDVLNTSVVGVHLLHQRGVLTPVAPENMRVLKDIPKLVTKVGGVPLGWNPRYGVRVFTYNTNAVKEPPKDWSDLLNPRFKGRIAFDMDMRQVLPLACPEAENVGWGFEKVRNFLRQLAKQERQYSGQGRVMATWVASGKVDVLAGAALSSALDLRKKGAPVDAVLPSVITRSETLMAVTAKASHPNAARLMMYWIMSPESLRSLWDIGFYGNIFVPSQYYGDPSCSFYHDLGKGKAVVDFSVDCVQRAEKEKWVGVFRKDIGFE